MTIERDEVVGLCALCGPDTREQKTLRNSHHLTKSTYKYLNGSKAEGSRLLLSKEGEKVFSLGRQIFQNLLCDECEGLMSIMGEDYASVAILKSDISNNLPAPAYRILHQSLLPIWNQLVPANVYGQNPVLSVGSNLLPSIDSRQLYHYAIGFFWKATFEGWPHCPPLPLDAVLIERMRKFLRGGEFLKGYIIRVVPSFWWAKYAVSLPALVRCEPFFSVLQFDFYLERADAEYTSAISMGAVPLFYTVDALKSERSYRDMIAHYRRAEQGASAAGTRLSWLDQ